MPGGLGRHGEAKLLLLCDVAVGMELSGSLLPDEHNKAPSQPAQTEAT